MPTTDKASGRTFWYFRRRGHKLIPMPNLPHDDPEFLAAYAEALRTTRVRHKGSAPGTLAALIDATLASEKFAGLSKIYQATMTRHMMELQATVGTARYNAIAERHVRANLAQATSGSDRLKAWRYLFTFALEAGLLETDPSRYITAPQRPKTEGHPPWTIDEIEAFRTRWTIGTVKRAAFELLFWTGCRIGDGVRIGPGMVDRDGVLQFRQKKTGGLAYVPWACTLPAYADERMGQDRTHLHAAMAELPGGHMTFLATAQGRTRSDKALGTMIREAARDAGIQKSAHGLRKARAVALADAGATTHQIGAWTGHESLKEIEHYTTQADRRRAVMGENKSAKVQSIPAQSAKSEK